MREVEASQGQIKNSRTINLYCKGWGHGENIPVTYIYFVLKQRARLRPEGVSVDTASSIPSS